MRITVILVCSGIESRVFGFEAAAVASEGQLTGDAQSLSAALARIADGNENQHVMVWEPPTRATLQISVIEAKNHPCTVSQLERLQDRYPVTSETADSAISIKSVAA
jgi:hypothetical protein